MPSAQPYPKNLTLKPCAQPQQNETNLKLKFTFLALTECILARYIESNT